MIQLSRLNGGIIAINPDLVTWIEVTPDTTIEFLNGDRIMVRESLQEVMDRVVQFRRSVIPPLGASVARPPSPEAVRAADAGSVEQSVPRPSWGPARHRSGSEG